MRSSLAPSGLSGEEGGRGSSGGTPRGTRSGAPAHSGSGIGRHAAAADPLHRAGTRCARTPRRTRPPRAHRAPSRAPQQQLLVNLGTDNAPRVRARRRARLCLLLLPLVLLSMALLRPLYGA
jgi:hypothetical protein